MGFFVSLLLFKKMEKSNGINVDFIFGAWTDASLKSSKVYYTKRNKNPFKKIFQSHPQQYGMMSKVN